MNQSTIPWAIFTFMVSLSPQMESMFATMPGAGDMATVEEEEAGEDGTDMATTQIQQTLFLFLGPWLKSS